jgi:hypothetical protein
MPGEAHTASATLPTAASSLCGDVLLQQREEMRF